MTKVSEHLYSYILPGDAENVIFNNGSTQTTDLLLPSISSNQNMYDYASGTWKAYSEDGSGSKFYLFGYINGKDYACEGDAANMGQYKFVDGKLEVCFEQDSYLAVKSENNGKWYMTDGWLGTDATSATLFDTAITGESSNKLYVPGNVKVVFTLKENADGTLTLNYTKTQQTFTIVGSINGISGTAELSLSVAGEIAQRTASDGSFEFTGLLPGAYLLTISHTERITRSYSVQIISENVELAVLLCRPGDVNADGKLNLGDTARIYGYIRSTVMIDDQYALLCADLDQNEKINLGDVARCYATVRSN